MNHIILPAALSLFALAAAARADVLLDENFEKATAGTAPVTATAYSPRKASGTLAVVVVEGADNKAGGGSGKGARILDNDPKSAALEYNIVASEDAQKSSVKISFDIAWNEMPGATASMSMSFGAGKFAGDKGSLASQANRFFTASFYANGTVRFVAGASAKSKTQQLGGSGARNHFDIYLNDAAAAVKTKAPDGKPLAVEADSMVAYQNGKQVFSGKVEKFNGAEKQIGRVGFVTTSTAIGLDFNIDNLRVEDL